MFVVLGFGALLDEVDCCFEVAELVRVGVLIGCKDALGVVAKVEDVELFPIKGTVCGGGGPHMGGCANIWKDGRQLSVH